MKTHEIDFQLALAIGYAPDRVRIVWPYDFARYVQVLNDYSRSDGPMESAGWQRFEHTDPAVIWPIAARFDAFPYKVTGGQWYAHISADCFAYRNNPATASALAVIQYVESKA